MRYPKQKFENVSINEPNFEIETYRGRPQYLRVHGNTFHHWTPFFVYLSTYSMNPGTQDGLYNEVFERLQVTKEEVIEKCRAEFKSNKEIVRELDELLVYMGDDKTGFREDFRRHNVEAGLWDARKSLGVSEAVFIALCREIEKNIHPPGIIKFTHRHTEAVWQYIEGALRLDPESATFEDDMYANMDRINGVYDEDIRKQYREKFKEKLRYMTGVVQR